MYYFGVWCCYYKLWFFVNLKYILKYFEGILRKWKIIFLEIKKCFINFKSFNIFCCLIIVWYVEKYCEVIKNICFIVIGM